MADPSLGIHITEFAEYLSKAKKQFDQRWTANFEQTGTLADFRILRTISSGSFGRVILAAYKESNKVIALKIMPKAHIVQMKQVQHTLAEIRVMDALKFDFLVAMECFFTDNSNLFLGMPFINGGELFVHLRREKKFSEVQTKFIAAQVILAFEYMHYMGLVYRDLKPENILLDSEGYIKVTDYGFAKKIDNGRTWTLCGTPEYLAPEVIMSIGYNRSVDWWAIGILIFEMAAGFTPFYSKESMKMYEKIVAGKFQYPMHFSSSLRNICGNLITVDRTKRLGMLKGGPKDVKSHEYFKMLIWDDILQRKVNPKYKPKVSGPLDHSNFDPIEELPMKNNPTNEFSELFNVIQVKYNE